MDSNLWPHKISEISEKYFLRILYSVRVLSLTLGQVGGSGLELGVARLVGSLHHRHQLELLFGKVHCCHLVKWGLCQEKSEDLSE